MLHFKHRTLVLGMAHRMENEGVVWEFEGGGNREALIQLTCALDERIQLLI